MTFHFMKKGKFLNNVLLVVGKYFVIDASCMIFRSCYLLETLILQWKYYLFWMIKCLRKNLSVKCIDLLSWLFFSKHSYFGFLLLFLKQLDILLSCFYCFRKKLGRKDSFLAPSRTKIFIRCFKCFNNIYMIYYSI